MSFMGESLESERLSTDVPAIDSEETLLEQARGALSNCNWVVGECAARWTEKYARGRSDADFGSLIGLSGDQVYQRRRVWESFHDVRDVYPGLKWSHFYVALNWDDAAECLQWSQDQQATIAEMRAWRRAIHGEDLTVDPEANALQALDYDNITVRGAAANSGGGAHGGFGGDDDLPFEPNGELAGVGAGSAEATPYAPFRKDARGPGMESAGPEQRTGSSVATASGLSPLRVVKRSIGGLKKIQQSLAELSSTDFGSLPPEVINQLWDVYEELGLEIKRQD